MGILLWIVFGLAAGAAAKWAMPGPDPLGTTRTMLLGAAGALAGGWIGAALGTGSFVSFDSRPFLTAIAGAVFLLFCYRALAMRARA